MTIAAARRSNALLAYQRLKAGGGVLIMDTARRRPKQASTPMPVASRSVRLRN
jgi:hypothetical protein